MSDQLEPGALLVWAPNGEDEVFIAVNRLARDKSWADISCHTWAVGWNKRQRMPWPEGTEYRVWDQTDLDKQEARWEARGGDG